MHMNPRRKAAKFFLQISGISKLLLKLYPLAVSVIFGKQFGDRIEVIKPFFDLYFLAGSRQIRLGDPNDGGYILDANLDSVDLCLSFGIGDNTRFEDDISRFVERVFMFDHTIQSPALSNSNMTFFRKGLGITSSSDFFTLSEILDFALPFNDAILKIDIEGAEVEVLATFPAEDLRYFKQITMELHGLHSIKDDKYFSDLVKCLNNLNSHHLLISVHANNWGKFVIVEGVPFPDVLELTYLRKTEAVTAAKDFETIDLMPEQMSPNNPLESDISLNLVSRIHYISN